jgi:hypothetical protein
MIRPLIVVSASIVPAIIISADENGLKRDIWASPILTRLSPKEFISIVEPHILNHAKSFWKDDTGIDRDDLDGRIFLKIYDDRIVWVMGFKSKRRILPYGEAAFEVTDNSPNTRWMGDLTNVVWIPGIWDSLGNYLTESKTRDAPITTRHNPKEVIDLVEDAAFKGERIRSEFAAPDLNLFIREYHVVWLVGYHRPPANGLKHDEWTLRAELDDETNDIKLTVNNY